MECGKLGPSRADFHVSADVMFPGTATPLKNTRVSWLGSDTAERFGTIAGIPFAEPEYCVLSGILEGF